MTLNNGHVEKMSRRSKTPGVMVSLDLFHTDWISFLLLDSNSWNET